MSWKYLNINCKMEIHSGYLTIKTKSLLKPKQFNRYWCILYAGRGDFSPRIDLHENETQVGQNPCKKTIYLEEAKWIKTQSLEPAFSCEVKNKKQYIFVTDSKVDLKIWILNLCCVSKELFDTRHVIGIEYLDKMSSYLMEDGEEYVVTENILYGTTNDLSTFIVIADQTDACVQYGLKGVYKLCIGHSNVQLVQYDSEKEVVCWSIKMFKRFGHSPHTFFIETGTRSPMGAGKFVFKTVEGEKITECMNFQTELYLSQNRQPDSLPVNDISTTPLKPHIETNTVRAKAPKLPLKPKFSSLRKSLPDNTELMALHLANENKSARKGIPAFGVPVLISSTEQISNVSNHTITDGVEIAVKDENANSDGVSDLAANSSIENGTKQLLKWSISSQSVESSVSRKESKRVQKELKKEQKKREEEEKKVKKREEEEKKKEQKKREEEEKRIKKEQKKKQKEAKRPSVSSRSASVSDSKVSCETPAAEITSFSYTEVDLSGAAPEPSFSAEKIYSEPWGALPYMLPSANNESSQAEYAQPLKKIAHQTAAVEPRDNTHVDCYEDVQTTESGQIAPLVNPPKGEGDNDGGTDVYSHLHESQAEVVAQENIYGMASASPFVTVFDDENPYENDNSTTYECVG